MRLFSYFKNNKIIKEIINDSKSLLDYNENERAAQKLIEAINKYGENYNLYLSLGEIYYVSLNESEAKKWFSKAIEIEPYYFNAYFYRAQILLKEQKYFEAIKDFDRAILLYKREPSAYMKRAICYITLKNYKKALKSAIAYGRLTDNKEHAYNLIIATALCIGKGRIAMRYTEKLADLVGEEKAIGGNMADTLDFDDDDYDALEKHNKNLELSPNNIELLLRRGNYFVKNKEYEKAKLDFKKASVYGGRVFDDRVYDGLSKCYTGLNEIEEAINCYEKLIEISSNKHPYYYNIAQCYEKMDNYTKAFEYYDKSIEDDDKNEVYYNSRGCLYAKLKKIKEAISDFEVASSIRDDIVEYKYNLALAYKTINDIEKTINVYEDILEIEGENEHILMNLGKLCMKSNKINEAKTWFDSVIIMNNKCKEAYYYLGYIKYFENKFDEAIEYINKSIDSDENESAIVLRARCYLEGKEYNKAIDDYTVLIDMSKNYEHFLYRGIARSGLGDYKGGIEDYNNAQKLNPTSGQVYMSRGQNYKILNRVKEAIEDYKKAGNISYTYKAMAHYNIGMIYDSTGDYKKALYYLEKSIKINPRLEKADEIKSKINDINSISDRKTS